MKDELQSLQDQLDAAAKGLKQVDGKKMFGCHALWANGSVFALVWKTGRIGFRLPDEKHFDTLMGLDGAAPWKAGKMTMSHWVLVPESMHAKKPALAKWAKVAHGLALAAEPAKKAKKPTAKKPAAKKPKAKA